MVFDRHGNYLNCWGIGAITDPHGMTIVDDIVYITDRSDSVAVTFTPDGKPLQVLGKRGVHSDTGCEKPGDPVPRAAGPFNYPTEMVPSPSGDLYVSDGYRNARVHRFTRDGQLINSWGAPGKTAPGHFHLPHSVLVARRAGLRLRPHQPACANFLCRRGVPQHVDWHGRANDIARDNDGVFTSANRKPTASRRLSVSATATVQCSPAGRFAMPTGYGWIPTVTSIWG